MVKSRNNETTGNYIEFSPSLFRYFDFPSSFFRIFTIVVLLFRLFTIVISCFRLFDLFACVCVYVCRDGPNGTP